MVNEELILKMDYFVHASPSGVPKLQQIGRI